MTTATPQRTLWLAAGGLLAACFTLWAGFSLAGWTVGSVKRDTHRVLPGPVSEVQVFGASGDVTLVPTSGRRVVVDGHAKATLWLPDMETRIDGGRVTVRGTCHVVVFGSCSASFVIGVPDGTPVTVRTSSGDVRASGLTGPVNLKVSSGDVTLDELSGGTTVRVSSGDIAARRLGDRVELETSSGDVTAAELTAPVVSARATSGDVLLDLATAPRRVNAAASSGDVTIAVPRGSETYDAEASASSGDHNVYVNDSSQSTRSLSAITSSGDATIAYR
jgi:DUF4097 and DUF4098 domain-containing protein YvlB